MARTEGMTRRGPVDSNEFHRRRLEALVEDGSHIWMIRAATGEPAAVLNTPEAIERKRKQGFVDAEVVEEVVKRPVVKSASAKAESAAKKPASKGGE